MKTIALFFIIFLAAAVGYCDGDKHPSPDDSSVSDSRGTHLWPIVQNGKWGYIDKTGKIVIAPQFDFAYSFSFGDVGFVNVGGKSESINIGSTGIEQTSITGGKWGLVNDQGQMVIAPQFDAVLGGSMSVNSGTTGINPLSGFILGGKWGLIDKTGKIIVPTKYNYPLFFRDGLAPINVGGEQGYVGTIDGGKWGFIDKIGKIVIEPKFDKALPFSKGLACVSVGGHFISKKWPGTGPTHTFEVG